jgi:beta-mannosidase
MTSLSLEGAWTLSRTDTSESWPASVPGCNFSDLLRAGAIPDPFFGRNEYDLHWVDDTDWEYRRAFTVDAGLLSEERLELVCEGLDTLAEIFINGYEAGRADNMFRTWRFDVKPFLKAGDNTIVIRFPNPTAYCQQKVAEWNHRIDDGAAFLGSLIRKQHSSFSWDWAPALPPSGIHRPIRIEASGQSRLDGARILQNHSNGRVILNCAADFVHGSAPVRWCLKLRGETVAEALGEDVSLEVASPELWWPHGHGDQSLYDLTAEPADPAMPFTARSWRVGLRVITLETPDDEHGQAFYFKVNGRAIYAKGANWCPPHQWASQVTRELYSDLLVSARDAHFNMIRMWGGGLYEQESFYDLCDELGLLVWHDFLFSCSLYPGAPEFLTNITAEAEEQTRRLAHRACLALWCGNNELEHFIEHIKKTPEREAAFLKTFYDILPGIVSRCSPQTPYWPGSPHNPKGWDQGPSVEDGGDGHHYWTGWDKPGLPEGGTDKLFRFCSEFGLQAFPSKQLVESFTTERGRNWFSPEVECHEKSPGMLVQMLRDIGRLYALPDSFDGQILASQFVQARHLQVAIEHHRRNQPRCMGSLYWQLNDTWPAISWSTIEFGGRWKPAHYAVKRSFAPTIVSIQLRQTVEKHLHGRETTRHEAAEFHLINDDPAGFRGLLRWSIRHLDGRILAEAAVPVECGPLHADIASSVPLEEHVENHGADCLIVVALLEADGGCEVSRRTAFLVPPKQIAFPRGDIACEVIAVQGRPALRLSSPVFQHGVWLDFADSACRPDDNGFDLLPGEARVIPLHGGHPPQAPPQVISLSQDIR